MTSGWNAVTRSDHCPVCDGADNCKVSTDGDAVWCGRQSEGSKRTNAGGQHLHILRDSQDWRQLSNNDHANGNGKATDYAALAVASAKDAQAEREQLAELLGVSVEPLQSLGIGFGDIGGQCYTVPERNARGRIVGINRRFLDGQKKSVGSRGLTYADNWDQDPAGPVLLVEGGSDVAALMSMKLSVIGRPSNVGGKEQLVDLIRLEAIPNQRPIIVIGENDRLKDGQPRRSHEQHGSHCECGECFPGMFGARTLAKQLGDELGRPIDLSMPPEGAKDSRAWLNSKGDVDPVGLGLLFKSRLQPMKTQTGLILRTAGELVRQFPTLRPAIIQGLLRCGETMNIIAASKFGKSWLMLMLAFCVACGPRKWLDKFWTTRGKVLYVDNELHPETLAHRLPLVAQSLGLQPEEWADDLTIVTLRGSLLDLPALSQQLMILQPGEFALIVLDAWYRFQPKGSDENANGDVMALYNLLDAVADRIGSAFVCVHHSSKGDQSGKAVTDVGSGAGAQSRAADCHLVMRAHEEDRAVVVEAVARSWAPPDPFCMRWAFPLWTVAEDLDPADIKTAKSRRKPQDATEPNPEAIGLPKEEQARLKVLEAYETSPDGNTESKLSAAAGMNSRVFGPIHSELLRNGFAIPCKVRKNNGATYDGFKLSEAGLTELRQLRQLRQTGGESELSDTTPTTALSLESGVSRSASVRSENSDRILSDIEAQAASDLFAKGTA